MAFELQTFGERRASSADVTTSVRKSTPNFVTVRIGKSPRIKCGFKAGASLLPYVDKALGQMLLRRAEKHETGHESARKVFGKSGASVYVDIPINDTLKVFFGPGSKHDLEVLEASADRLIVKLIRGEEVVNG